jgi:hypothetical protein
MDLPSSSLGSRGKDTPLNNTILVGYDLNRPGKDYAKVIEKLKTFPGWWHCLDSTWLINTSLTPVQVHDELRPLMDSTDELLVMDVTGDSAAWSGFDTTCSDWLKTNI